MRNDDWLAARLGRPAITWEPGDEPSAVAAAARVKAPAFAQARVACEDVAATGALEDAGFRIIDVTVTVERSGPLAALAEGAVEVADARKADRARLLEIAERHYDVSRFHRDPRIGADVAATIKHDWLANALDGRRGDGVLCATVAGAPAGFLVTLRPEPNVSVIDLIAVHADHRRARVGAALVAALSGDGRVRAGTQIANVGALRFYARLGFVTVDTRFVLHLHA